MEKRIKRVKITAFVGLVAMLALACRLYYIQVMCQEELTEGALRQQVIQVQRKDSRGAIYDRNMIKLTDSCASYYYLIKKSGEDEEFLSLMQVLGGEPAGSKGEDYAVWKTDTFDEEINEKLIEKYGAYPFCGSRRYRDDQIAAHLIGYVSGTSKTGAFGLERMFQYRLAASDVMLTMMGNGIGEPVQGIGVTEKSSKKTISPSAVVTTVDSGLQAQVEKILAKKGIEGAAVVLQASTGQVLAMASTPSFNPNKVEEYLESDSGELINKAVQGQYPPGSVFKIVVAAAALESGIVNMDETFECKGSVTVNGVKLICDDHPKGHGKVDFEKAFALSCNGFFAKTAEKLGSETIIEMAKRMGLGETVIENFPDEEAGQFPSEEERGYSGLSNLAVGQGSLLTTPLQIAKLTNIIACKGLDHQVTVTMSEKSQTDPGKRVMNETTALRIGKMMEKVMTEGTGARAKLHTAAAGKTGSAESGNKGAYTVHGWFTGYFPAEDPEYTVTVLAENGKTGSRSALPVFEEIVNYLY